MLKYRLNDVITINKYALIFTAERKAASGYTCNQVRKGI